MDYIEWFSKRISQLRVEKGVSARDMSLSLGQSESYINKIENGYTLPSMSGFIYICEYFGISPKDFFDIDSPSPSKQNELLQEIKKLSPEKAGHILAILRDLNN